ncbi:MAG: cupin domain-containing protein [Armatimonadia bacterium]|nr:cupin domain-containing protein [Armatimonadia bacterium]
MSSGVWRKRWAVVRSPRRRIRRPSDSESSPRDPSPPSGQEPARAKSLAVRMIDPGGRASGQGERPAVYVYLSAIEGQTIAPGVLLKNLGQSENMNVLHWDIDDGAAVPLHHHPEEQFGYVIKGGFRMFIGDDEAELHAGDGYFIPSNVPHRFVALGQTEAIDVFSPVRQGLPGGQS